MEAPRRVAEARVSGKRIRQNGETHYTHPVGNGGPFTTREELTRNSRYYRSDTRQPLKPGFAEHLVLAAKQLTHERVRARPVPLLVVHKLPAFQGGTNRFHSLKPMALKCHDHPPMIVDTTASASLRLGISPFVQHHLALDNSGNEIPFGICG